MPFLQPDRNALHTDVPLTDVSLAYFQDESHFIADKVFPTFPVSKSSNKYYTYPQGVLNRLQVEKRSRGADPAFATRLLGSDTYNCDSYALGENVSVEDMADADDPFDLDVDATEFLTRQGLINREKLWTESYFKAGIWNTDITGVASGPTGPQVIQWNDDAATPIEDVQAGKDAILQNTGQVANTFVIGHQVASVLRNHPTFIDRVKYGQTSGGPAIADEAVMAELFGVERVLISKGIINTANEGAADSNAFIAGKKALLCHVAARPGKKVPSAGYTFAWNVYSSQGMRIRRRSMDEAIGHDIIMDDAFDQKLVASDLGYFFDSIVA